MIRLRDVRRTVDETAARVGAAAEDTRAAVLAVALLAAAALLVGGLALLLTIARGEE